jgi:hypothetical protein
MSSLLLFAELVPILDQLALDLLVVQLHVLGGYGRSAISEPSNKVLLLTDNPTIYHKEDGMAYIRLWPLPLLNCAISAKCVI